MPDSLISKPVQQADNAQAAPALAFLGDGAQASMQAAGEKQQQAEHKRSYLEAGVNLLTSTFIHNEKTRDEVNQYATGFVTTAALFAGGRVGLVGTGLAYGLAQAKVGDTLSGQAEDFVLGAAKGETIKGLYSVASRNLTFAPTKGVLMGIGSRAAEAIFQRDTFSDPSHAMSRLKAETINPQAWLMDAAVWTAGEGLFHGANRLSGGALAENRIASGMFMGGSFGAINGSAAEIMRQKNSGEQMDWGAVVRKGLIQGGVDAVAARAGMGAENINWSGLRPDASVSVVKADSTVPTAEIAKASEAKPVSDAVGQAPSDGKGSSDTSSVVVRTADGQETSLDKSKIPVSVYRNRLYHEPFSLESGDTTITLMAPLVVGDPVNPHGEESKSAWDAFDKQLAESKQLGGKGVDAISTDVWWGLVEPKQGEYHWDYYDKLAKHIADAGLKWVPILSFHQCGGNVGDNVNVPLPEWVFPKVAADAGVSDPRAVQFVSEQGNASREYVSFWATERAMPYYADVMKNFQEHFANRAPSIAEINISLGPSGELRYPSYNSHDQGTGYPTRGALQSYSELAKQSFRNYALTTFGGIDGVRQRWNIPNLVPDQILPPSNPNEFFGRNDHFNTQYGRDFIDWYANSPIQHGRQMLTSALNIFGAKDAPFRGIEIGGKIPGIHWRVGHWDGSNIAMSDRLAEVDAGLIRTSGGDWNSDEAGRGYRPILHVFSDLGPLSAATGNRLIPSFTATEFADGQGGDAPQSMAHSLATWVGQEAARQGLTLKGENALAGNLGDPHAWDLMKSLLALPNDSGYYHGMTFLRMGDVLASDVAKQRLGEIIQLIHSAVPPAAPSDVPPTTGQPAGGDNSPVSQALSPVQQAFQKAVGTENAAPGPRRLGIVAPMDQTNLPTLTFPRRVGVVLPPPGEASR